MIQPVSEPDVIDLLRAELSRDPETVRWLFRESLPQGHALAAGADAARPVVAAMESPEPDILDVCLEDPGAGWRLLVIVTARVTQPLTRAQHDATRARANAAKEERRVSGSLVIVVAPRRFIRDSGNAGRYSRCITLENLGDWLRERGEAAPERAPALREWKLRLLEGAEHQVRVAAEAASAAQRRVWGEYDTVLAGYAAHLRIVKREPTPGSDVFFDLTPRRRLPFLPGAALRHSLREHRAAIDITGLGEAASATAARLREDLPMDIFIDQTPRVMTLWLRLPPLEVRGSLAGQANDLRHAFGALWRLKNWFHSTMDRWEAWRGLEPARSESGQSAGDAASQG